MLNTPFLALISLEKRFIHFIHIVSIQNKINRQSLPYKGWYLAHVHALKPCRSYIHQSHIPFICRFLYFPIHCGVKQECILTPTFFAF